MRAFVLFIRCTFALRGIESDIRCFFGDCPRPPPPPWHMQPDMVGPMQKIDSKYDTFTNDIVTNGPNMTSISSFYNSSLSETLRLLHGLIGWDGDDGQPSSTAGIIHLANVASGLLMESGMTAQNISDAVDYFKNNISKMYNPTLQATIPIVINATVKMQNMSNLAATNTWVNSNILTARINWFMSRIKQIAGNTTVLGDDLLTAYESYLANTLKAEEALQMTNVSYNTVKANLSVNAMTNAKPSTSLTDKMAALTATLIEKLSDLTYDQVNALVDLTTTQSGLLATSLAAEVAADSSEAALWLKNRTAASVQQISDAGYKANATIKEGLAAFAPALENVTIAENKALSVVQLGANITMGMINDTLAAVSNVTESTDNWRYTADITTADIIDKIAESKNTMIKQARDGYQTASNSLLSNVLNLAKSSDAIKDSLKEEAASLNSQMTAIAATLASDLGMSMSDFSNLSGNIGKIVDDIQKKFGDKVNQKVAATNDDLAAISTGMEEKLQSSALAIASAANLQSQLNEKAFTSTATVGIGMLQDYHQKIADDRATLAKYQDSVAKSGAYAGMADQANAEGSAIASKLQSAIDRQRQVESILTQGKQVAKEAEEAVASSTASVSTDLQGSIDNYVNAFPALLQPQLDARQTDFDSKVGSYLNASISKAQSLQVRLDGVITNLKNRRNMLNTAVTRAASGFAESSTAFDDAVNASDTSINATITSLNTTVYTLESTSNASLADAIVNSETSQRRNSQSFSDSATLQIASKSRGTSPKIATFVKRVNSAGSDASTYIADYATHTGVINQSLAESNATLAALTAALTAILPEALLVMPVQFIQHIEQATSTLDNWNISTLQNISDSDSWYSNATADYGLSLQAGVRDAAALSFMNPVSLATLVRAIQANLSAPVLNSRNSASMNMTDALVRGMNYLAGNMSEASDILMANISTAFEQQQQSLYNTTTLTDLSATLDELDQLTGNSSSNASFIDSVLASVSGVAGTLMKTSADVTSQAIQSVRNQMTMTSGNSGLVARLEAAATQANMNLLSSAALAAAGNLKNSNAALEDAKFAARNNAVDVLDKISSAKGAQAQVISSAFQAVSNAQASVTTSSVINEAPLVASTAQQTIGLWNAYSPEAIEKTNTYLKDQAVALDVINTLIQQRLNMSSSAISLGVGHVSGVAGKLASVQIDIDKLANATHDNFESITAESASVQKAAADLKTELMSSLDSQVLAARAQAEAEAASASDYISSLVSNLTQSVNAVPVSLGLVEA